jgi:NADH:ubiquinone oxidoreductase subunit 6 (subunit J)
LLTRGTDLPRPAPIATSPWWGVGIAIIAFLTTAMALARSSILRHGSTPQPEVTVHTIGDKLMHEFVLPLEIIGLLLTAALIGAVIIAMSERKEVK